MKNDARSLAVAGVFQNLFLAILKLGTGILTGSIAVLAEGIHSAVDILSSLAAWWGIKEAAQPADKEHPYGHARYETVASFVVTLALFGGGLWIILEAIQAVFGHRSLAEFSFLNVGVMLLSVVINEAMARWKFQVGNESNVLALVADGQHDQADVISSAAILIGVILVRWIPLADAILALAVGAYIIYESVSLARETIELLVDTANPELEEKVKRFLSEQNFQFENIRSRRIGSSNLLEATLLFNPDAKMQEVDQHLNDLEKKLLENFSELSQAVLTVKSHAIKESVTRPWFWGKFRQRGRWEPLGSSKSGRRFILPVPDEKGEAFFPELGAPYYWVLDFNDGKMTKKEIVKNPHYQKDSGRGVRFAKAVGADVVATGHISPDALENLKRNNIEVEEIKNTDSISNIIERISENIEKKGGENYARI